MSDGETGTPIQQTPKPDTTQQSAQAQPLEQQGDAGRQGAAVGGNRQAPAPGKPTGDEDRAPSEGADRRRDSQE